TGSSRLLTPQDLVREVRYGVYTIDVPAQKTEKFLDMLEARGLGWNRKYADPEKEKACVQSAAAEKHDILKEDWRKRHAPALKGSKAIELLARYPWHAVEGGTHAPAGLAA